MGMANAAKIDAEIISLLTRNARSTQDLLESIRLRMRITRDNLWTHLRRLEVDGRVQREGIRGSFVWSVVVADPPPSV